MSDRAAMIRLQRELASIQAEKIPHVVARPSERSMLTWHFVLHDLPIEAPYTGGVYWGKLVFAREYPLKPPSIYMLTPSGRFETNVRLCLSMSDFHPECWNPSWRIESILVGLLSFMLDTNEPGTTGGIYASPLKRREYARSSFDFNRRHQEFSQLFPEFCDQAKAYTSCGFFLDPPSPSALQTLQARAEADAREVLSGGTPVIGAAARGGVDRGDARRAPQHIGTPAAVAAFTFLLFLASLLGFFSAHVGAQSDGDRYMGRNPWR